MRRRLPGLRRLALRFGLAVGGGILAALLSLYGSPLIDDDDTPVVDDDAAEDADNDVITG